MPTSAWRESRGQLDMEMLRSSMQSRSGVSDEHMSFSVYLKLKVTYWSAFPPIGSQIPESPLRVVRVCRLYNGTPS
jgi:hypothetical protein